jgi:type I restriction enzyme, S subunit
VSAEGLPGHWTKATLGEIASTQLGKMLSAKARQGANPRPYLGNKNVQWGRFELDDLKRMDFSENEFEKFGLKPGDLVVCEGGEVGRCAVWAADEPMAIQKAIHRVRPGERVSSKWLYYYFEQLAASGGFADYVSGIGIAHLPQEDLRRIPIPLPPRDEQERIVESVESALAPLDDGMSDIDATLALATVFREKTLSSAFAADWPRKPFSEVASVEANLVDPAAHGDLPHIAPNHIESKTGRLLTYTTVAADGVKSANHLFQPGQIIYSKIRPYLAKAAIVDFQGLCSADMYPLSTSLVPEFLLYWLISPDFTALAATKQGRSVLPKINKKDLGILPVPTPSPEIQQETVRRVREALAAIDDLVAFVEQTAKLADNLRSTVLAAAFAGRITSAVVETDTPTPNGTSSVSPHQAIALGDRTIIVRHRDGGSS